MIIEKDIDARKRASDKEKEAQGTRGVREENSTQEKRREESQEKREKKDTVEWNKEFESRSKFWKGVPADKTVKDKESERLPFKKPEENRAIEPINSIGTKHDSIWEENNSQDIETVVEAKGSLSSGINLAKITQNHKMLFKKSKQNSAAIKTSENPKTVTYSEANKTMENTTNLVKIKDKKTSEIVVENTEENSSNIEWNKEFESRAKFWKSVPSDVDKIDKSKESKNNHQETLNGDSNQVITTQKTKLLQNDTDSTVKIKTKPKIEHDSSIATVDKTKEIQDTQIGSETDKDLKIAQAPKVPVDNNAHILSNKTAKDDKNISKKIGSETDKNVHKIAPVPKVMPVNNNAQNMTNKTAKDEEKISKTDVTDVSQITKSNNKENNSEIAQVPLMYETITEKKTDQRFTKLNESINLVQNEAKNIIQDKVNTNTSNRTKKVTFANTLNDQTEIFPASEEIKPKRVLKVERQNSYTEIFIEEAQIDITIWNREFEARTSFWKGISTWLIIGVSAQLVVALPSMLYVASSIPAESKCFFDELMFALGLGVYYTMY